MSQLFPQVFAAPTFVLDLSVPLRWLVVSQGNAYTSAVLSRMSSSAVAVPAGWPTLLAERIRAEEMASVVTAAKADRFLRLFRSFSVVVDSADDEHVWDETVRYSRTYTLPVAEAQLLELAHRLRLPLATDDGRLSAAANALGVPIFRP